MCATLSNVGLSLSSLLTLLLSLYFFVMKSGAPLLGLARSLYYLINYEIYPFILEIFITDGSLQLSKNLYGLVNARDFEQCKHIGIIFLAICWRLSAFQSPSAFEICPIEWKHCWRALPLIVSSPRRRGPEFQGRFRPQTFNLMSLGSNFPRGRDRSLLPHYSP